MEELAVIILTVMIAVGATMTTTSYQTGRDALPLIEQCEEQLPRNQHCVLQAVAEGE